MEPEEEKFRYLSLVENSENTTTDSSGVKNPYKMKGYYDDFICPSYFEKLSLKEFKVLKTLGDSHVKELIQFSTSINKDYPLVSKYN